MIGSLSRKAVAFAAAAMLALSLSTLTAGGAAAASVNLSGTAYPSKTYHSVPRYKAATGGASISGVTYNAIPSSTCGGTGLNTGFRSVVGIGEVTQFPSMLTGSATYRNIEAPPAYNLTFAAGTYYMNSQMMAATPGCGMTWSGTLTW